MRRKIGSSWKGPRYIHGPRLKNPKLFSEFRLSKPTKKGIRLVFGKNKRTGRWEVQSELIPRRRRNAL